MTAALTWAGPALAKTATQSASAPLASGGTVSATLSYTAHPYYASNIALSITRNGQALRTGALATKLCPSDCEIGNGPGTGPAIHVADVQGNGEPDVFIDLYTGGAHCCSVTEFFTYDATTQTYVQSEYNWGDPGYRLLTLGGQKVFETGDDRFAYAFTDYAASGLPLQLFSFNGTTLVDVTAQYPKLIAKDAAEYLTAYKSSGKYKWDDTVGVIAAWAADEDLLGHQAYVVKYLKAQAKLGRLNSALSGTAGIANGFKFIKNLNRFLKKTGYLK